VPKKTWWGLCALAVTVALVAAGCGSSKKSSTSGGGTSSNVKGSIAVLLPDTQSSVRWEQFDRKYLNQAFT
jgi:D-xylose transport system substrate-binding protein